MLPSRLAMGLAVVLENECGCNTATWVEAAKLLSADLPVISC
jgi:hypothetical protein